MTDFCDARHVDVVAHRAVRPAGKVPDDVFGGNFQILTIVRHISFAISPRSLPALEVAETKIIPKAPTSCHKKSAQCRILRAERRYF
ncbi:MAG: hypothetical protein M3O46_00420 [Myxococcota bacterium]|nr:hypothetical protein [Myxococcota bacterium]